MIHRFHTEVAAEYGVIEAIMYYHISYWVMENLKEKKHLHADRYWTYDSVRELATTTHSYLTENQIRRALNHLVAEDVLEGGNFNKTTYDRTFWYTLTEKGWSILRKIQMEEEKRELGIR